MTKKNCDNPLRLIVFLCVLLMSSVLFAQNRTVTGTIKDANGVPLAGATIIQKGTQNGTSTDFDGNFNLTLVLGNQVLTVSFIGYQTKEVDVSSQTTIAITLEEDSAALDEVVVIGYAPIAREKVLGAMSSVDSEEIQQITPINAFDAVQGRLSGVQILTNGGPGAGFDIRIRGTSTFSQGGNEPLYVVDGQQLSNIDNLDPNDIESLEVLKDGATAAIYGSKAGNGVVLITTKSGRSGELRIDVTGATAITELLGEIPLANSNERRFYERVRGNPNNLTGNERDSLSLLQRNSFDLQDLLTRTAIRQQVNVAVSGGGEKANFYWNNGFIDEQGVIVNSSYKRINSLFKLDINPAGRLKVGTKANLSFEDQYGLNEGQVFQQMVERIPYFPIFEPDGSFTPESAGRQNPVAEANARTLRNRNYRAQIFNYAQYDIFPTLSLKSTLGVNFRYNKRNSFEPSIVQNPNNDIARGSEDRRMDYDIQQENFVNYREKFGKHSVSGFAGMQIQKFYTEEFDVSAQFVSDAIQTFNNIDPLTFSLDRGVNSRNNLFSLFGGFNYDYDNKYLVGATIRRDGSSRFGDNKEYGYFPSATVGWRVSKESFMENVSWIDNLLLRASFGVTGNERIGDYEFTGAYLPGAFYNGVSGVAPTRLGNPDLGWESTEATNIGLELDMFKRRAKFNLDFWRKETSDLLASVPLPEESGFSGIRQNVGAIRNEGIDLSLSGTIINNQNFSWNSSFNITFLRNEVLKLAGGTSFFSGEHLIEEGQPLGNISGWRNLGVYQYDESNAYTDDGGRLTPNFNADGVFENYTLNGAVFNGNVNQLRNGGNVLEGGDIIWDDVNGDFDITVDDRQIIGNGIADVFGGLSNDFRYKGLSLSFLFDFNFGNDIYRRYDEARNDLNSSNETPGPDRINGAWLNPGDVTVFPRLNRVSQNRERPNSFFVTSGDYIKLRFVRFNYDMPASFLEKVDWIKAMSFNLSFNNWATWTNYIGYNPELGTRGNPLEPGVDNLRYPNKRDIILGMRVQF